MRSLTRFVEIVLCGLLLAALTPAYSASFGRSTVGATPSAGLRADFKRGSKFGLTEKGTFQDICIYVDMKGGGTGTQAIASTPYASGAPNTLYEGPNPAGQPVVQRGTGRVSVFGSYQAAYTP
jgi:hypothetical protein